jgi:hypothetical protein
MTMMLPVFVSTRRLVSGPIDFVTPFLNWFIPAAGATIAVTIGASVLWDWWKRRRGNSD